MIKYKPIYNHVLILRDPDEDKVESSVIIVPDSSKNPSSFGTIVAVGDGYVTENNERREMPVSVGDRVLFDLAGGFAINIENSEYIVCKDTDVCLVIEEEVDGGPT